MILGLDRESTLKKLLGERMFKLYLSYLEVNSLEDSKVDKKEVDSLKESTQDVLAIGFSILKKALYYTPVKTGRLLNSAYIKRVGTGVAIGYSEEYAIYVHEIGFYQHEPPTKYKFLEDAAYEVALETKSPYRISISYEPLAVYVNVPDEGIDLISVKGREFLNQLSIRKQKVWEDFINFNPEKASLYEKIYFSIMADFFKYWSGRHYDYQYILEQWLDRTRHDLL